MAGKTLDVQTLISKDCCINGDITLNGTIKIDGKLNGNLKTKGDVIIAAKAEVTGNIYAHNVLIAGTVTGDVTAKGQVSVMSKGKLKGDITYFAMAMDEDAEISGSCTLKTKSAKKS